MSKLSEVSSKLRTVLKKILEDEDIDMPKLHSIINKFKLEHLSNLENSPHGVIAMMIIGHMLYGNTKNDVSFERMIIIIIICSFYILLFLNFSLG